MRSLLLLAALLLSASLLLLMGLGRITPPNQLDKKKISSPSLIQESTERQAKRVTLRIRNNGCRAISTGSAFLAQEKLLITNRHVIDQSKGLEINTWDGESLSLQLSQARVSPKLDIGFIRLEKKIEIASRLGDRAIPGEPLTVVGYPKGEELTVGPASLRGYIAGRKLLGKQYSGQIMILKAKVQPGNSGGPVLNQAGRVVGVIFAASLRKGKTVAAYAIPIKEVLSLANRGKTRPLASC